MTHAEFPPLDADEIFFDRKMLEEVPEETIRDLISTMRRGDCQTCGASLVKGAVSVYAEVTLTVLANVSIHHPTCRPPQWNDGGGSGVIQVPKVLGDHNTYLTAGFISETGIPAVVINPFVETAALRGDQDGWRLGTLEVFESMGLLPGGPFPAVDRSVVGTKLVFRENFIDLDVGGLAWTFSPGAKVVSTAKAKSGVLLVATSMYAGEDLSPELVMRIVSHPRFTRQGWIPLQPKVAKGAPAAEYVIYRNRHYAMVGQVIGRTAELPSNLEAWAQRSIRGKEGAGTPLIDQPGRYQDESAVWLMNPLSAKMYVVIPAADGVRLVESFARYGGDTENKDLIAWANGTLRVKSPHRVAAQWFDAGTTMSGESMWLAHAMPAES